jgi:hypothetical protein
MNHGKQLEAKELEVNHQPNRILVRITNLLLRKVSKEIEPRDKDEYLILVALI